MLEADLISMYSRYEYSFSSRFSIIIVFGCHKQNTTV